MDNKKFIVFGFLVLGVLLWSIWEFIYSQSTCDPQSAEIRLKTLSDKGIQSVQHPPSQSNLLWIHVGPAWHALPHEEKTMIDRVIRCAAQTFDAQNRPTWQAAYYDQTTRKLVALTSRKWGFRIKDQESHFAQQFPIPEEPRLLQGKTPD